MLCLEGVHIGTDVSLCPAQNVRRKGTGTAASDLAQRRRPTTPSCLTRVMEQRLERITLDYDTDYPAVHSPT